MSDKSKAGCWYCQEHGTNWQGDCITYEIPKRVHDLERENAELREALREIIPIIDGSYSFSGELIRRYKKLAEGVSNE